MKRGVYKKVTIEEAEQGNMLVYEPFGPDPVPFGSQYNDWKNLLSKMQEGDELWEYHSSTESFMKRVGSAGINLKRDGKVIASLVTIMS